VAVVFEQIWESSTPSKIIVFSWHLLYDRIPTRSNLIYRGIISPEEHMDCVGILESSSDLFLNCPSAMLVWYHVFRWLEVVIVMPQSLAVLFEVLRGAARNKKVRQGFLMI
jgi:hypothetical protein